jgi:hypothetical protein
MQFMVVADTLLCKIGIRCSDPTWFVLVDEKAESGESDF